MPYGDRRWFPCLRTPHWVGHPLDVLASWTLGSDHSHLPDPISSCLGLNHDALMCPACPWPPSP